MQERNTLQKRIVHETLIHMANHPTADDVVAEVQSAYPSISRATVYRILNKLADSGEALRIRINNGADHFDHQTFPHYHVHCSECGKVADVAMPVEELVDMLSDTSGYKIMGYSLQFDGLCPECAKLKAERGA